MPSTPITPRHSAGCLGPAPLLKVVRLLLGRVSARRKQRSRVLPTSLITVAPADPAGAPAHPVGADPCRGDAAPPGLQRCPLPLDTWGVVAEFVPSDVLSLVSSPLRQFLPRRHLVLRATPANVCDLVARYAGDPQVRQLALACYEMGDDAGTRLAFLGRLPSVEALTLRLNLHQLGNTLTDHTVRAVAAVATCRTMRRLHLDLQCALGGRGNGRLTDDSLEALADIRHCRALETLTLNLSHNALGDAGLATLVEAVTQLPRLQALDLNLTCSGVGNNGLVALARLGSVATLETLHLRLTTGDVGDVGVCALAAVLEAPVLRHLMLDLSCTETTNVGLTALLQAVRRAPRLQTLALNVSCTLVTAEGLRDLQGLVRDWPHVERLSLGLRRVATDDLARALTALCDAPALRRLEIDLANSPVTDAGAETLAGFREAPRLRWLSLDLSQTALGDAGAKILETLAHTSAMESVTLRMVNTPLSLPAKLALLKMQPIRA